MPGTIKVFISYSHKDSSYLKQDSLLGFLKGLEQDNIEFWTDKSIRPGERWDDEINTNIQNADIALVLVSQIYLDSYYCQTVEIQNFLAKKTHIFPIILSACDWHRREWLSSRQFLPGGDQTIEEHFQDEGNRKRLLLKIRESLRERADLIRQERSSRPEVPQMKWEGTPYPGLFAFKAEQAPIFFGRNREIKELLALLKDASKRFLVIIGASGSGKSSLVAAGLVPKLGEIWRDKTWSWVRFTPGELTNDPFLALASSLKPVVQRPGYDVRKIHGSLLVTSDISSVIDTNQIGPGSDAALLIFIDQFEELFTLVAEEYRKPFATLLKQMAETEGLHTVMTLRADFYHHCLDYPPLDALLNAGHYALKAPDLPAIMKMITGPAAVAGLSFEDGLLGQILRDTGSEPGSLALMAFALSALYNACQPSRHLTFAAYDGFKGVKGAIAKRAETAYNGLDGDAQKAFGGVFKELVEVDPERGIPTRKRATKSCFTSSPAAIRFIDKFASNEARLLVCGDPDKKEDAVEVSHEALLTHWPRLYDWITERFDDFRLRRQLQNAALDWDAHEQAEAYLWSDERVIEARGMLGRIDYSPNDLEQRFLGPIDPERMLGEINDPATSHDRRAFIGVRLALIGDPRRGVGLREDGLPDIVWCKVPGGEITLAEGAGTFAVAPFYIAKYLVTWVQYRAFLEDPGGYPNPGWWTGLLGKTQEPGRQFQKYANHPVDNVSWLAAMAFCRWLSQRLGYEVRLPTEWEWQQAATGGDAEREFPWGPEWNSAFANTYESGLNRSTAIGLYPQGAASGGALDMSGNLWEWCLNEHENPERTDVGGDARRVVRGGSWFNEWDRARATCRFRFPPDGRGLAFGFRVVCSSPIPS